MKMPAYEEAYTQWHHVPIIELALAPDHSERSGSTDHLFRCEGELWIIAHDGRTIHLHDTHGLQYIALLLRHPYRQFHALEMLSEKAGAAARGVATAFNSGPRDRLIDNRAKLAYRRRLCELRHELADTHHSNDLGHAERLQHEIDFLTRELLRGVGLRGRARTTGAPSERARVNVGRAIAAARQRIAAQHLPLGRHFDRTIKTGMFCVYAPDPRAVIAWEL